MLIKCHGCHKEIDKTKQTYWVVYPNKTFCGVDCYKKDQQQEAQKAQALTKK